MELSAKIAKIARARLREPSEPDNYYLKLNKKNNELFESIIRDEGKDTFPVDESKFKVNKSDGRLIKTKKTFNKKINGDFTGKNALQEIYSTLIHVVKKLKFITIEVENDYDAFFII